MAQLEKFDLYVKYDIFGETAREYTYNSYSTEFFIRNAIVVQCLDACV